MLLTCAHPALRPLLLDPTISAKRLLPSKALRSACAPAWSGTRAIARGASAALLAIAAAATSLALSPVDANAQASAGVGDDATPLSAKGARIRIGGLWSSYDSRFAPNSNGDSKKGGLFDGFRRDNLGVADLPRLVNAEADIRGLSGANNFSLSLGALEATGDVSKSVVPFQIDYGITNRLSLTVVVPYVETTANSRFILNRGGQGATVGANPAIGASGVRSANTNVVQQIATSRAALSAEVARCAVATETGGACDAIRANPGAAESLLSQSGTFSQQIANVYGTNTVQGSPLVPISRSATQTAIENRLAAFRTQFIAFSSNSIDATTRPAGAVLVYGQSGLQTIAKDTAFGLRNDSLALGGRAGMGDVDVAATFLWINTLGPSQFTRMNSAKRAIRSSVTGGFRFGTATGGRSGSPFDLPTGDGANAILAKSTTDLVWNRNFWVSGTVRYVKPLADNVVTRFPAIDDTSLFRPFGAVRAERKLGARTELEIAPRYGIGRSFALSAAYTLSRVAESTLNADPAGQQTLAENEISVIGYSTPALTVHAVQFGAAYSTLNAFTRGKSRWPLEIVYSHGITLAGTGGVVPATVFDKIELRIYTRFPRR